MELEAPSLSGGDERSLGERVIGGLLAGMEESTISGVQAARRLASPTTTAVSSRKGTRWVAPRDELRYGRAARVRRSRPPPLTIELLAAGQHSSDDVAGAARIPNVEELLSQLDEDLRNASGSAGLHACQTTAGHLLAPAIEDDVFSQALHGLEALKLEYDTWEAGMLAREFEQQLKDSLDIKDQVVQEAITARDQTTRDLHNEAVRVKQACRKLKEGVASTMCQKDEASQWELEARELVARLRAIIASQDSELSSMSDGMAKLWAVACRAAEMMPLLGLAPAQGMGPPTGAP
ncbi:hypothetical protein ACQ4PT_032102 [Festuca glaucescens]